MIYIWNTEPIESVPIEEIPDRFVDMVMPPKEEPKPVEQKQLQDENQKSEKEEEKPKEEEKKKKKKKKQLTEAEKQAKEAARLKKKKEDVLKKSKLLAGIIGTRGEGSEMTVEDVFADKEGSFQNLQDALQNAGGIDVASGDNIAMKGATDAGGRGDATIEDLKQSGGGSAKVTKVKAKVRKGSASMGAIDVSSGEAVDKIRAVLRKYSGQIKYCYEQRLRENPNLKGRIAIEVSVNAGKVAGVDIVENTTGDAGVGTCVSRKVKSWRFPSDVTDDIYLPFALASSG